MAIIDDIKAKTYDEIISETELENIMAEFGYSPLTTDEDSDNIVKFTNRKSQIWIDVLRDEENNVVCENARQVTKEKGETEVDPIHSFSDLKRIMDAFYNKGQYHHWLNAMLQTLLGRRVGDVCSLKWSEFYLKNGENRDRLKTLREEKTGKIVGLKQTDYVKEILAHYCELKGVVPAEHYNERIFETEAQSFRKAFKKVVEELRINYDISCHSFRKFFGNQSYKLHPNDADRVKIIQYLFGHSSEEITRRYIGEIDEKMDKYMDDMSNATKAYLEGEGYEVDDSPVLSIKTQDVRKIVSQIYLRGKQSAFSAAGRPDIDIINELITEVEAMRIK